MIRMYSLSLGALAHSPRSGRPRWLSVRAALCTLAVVALVQAEGSAQLGEEGLLTDEASGQTRLLVDVLPGDSFLNIAARATGSPLDVRVTTPGGVATTYTLTNSVGMLSPSTLPASIDNALSLDVSTEPGVYQVQFLEPEISLFDISITENTTDPIDPTAAPPGGGRVHTSSWHVAGELPVVDGLVVDYSFFARVPTTATTETLYRIDFEGIAGGDLCIVGNQLGLPGALSHTSQPLSAVNAEVGASDTALDYCEDLAAFELYLNPPNSPLPQPAAPSVNLSPGPLCGAVLEGSGATFDFSSDLPGTYQLIIDVDDNGFNPAASSNDVVLHGTVGVGDNSIVWDGLDRADAFVVASAAPYAVQLSVSVGELHVPAVDVEATDPGLAVSIVSPGDYTESATMMFWDDSAVLGAHTNNIPDPAVAVPTGQSSDSATRDWGDATTGDEGVGNDAFIDTWVALATTVEVMELSIVSPTADADGDGLDNARECAIGSSYDASDSDNDGLSDGAEGSPSGPLPDSDSDLTPDLFDDDDDNDGVLTLDESPDDDGDGLPNDALDSDGDGTPNYLDDDDDNDGVLTALEAVDDTDDDGTVNALDDDDDGDGIPTLDEDLDDSGTYDDDTDSDGTPNYLDADDDGDSISTALEISQAGATPDLDGDTIVNWLDDDSDGDGVSDAAEAAGTGDANGDGTPDYLDPVNAPADSDNDGIPDEIECLDLADCQDTDDDGNPDHLDDDDDGDGIPTADERPDSTDLDTDDDGIPDHLDDDDDGDSLPTLDERVGGVGVDSDGDSVPDYLDDDDDGDMVATLRERPGGENIDTDDDGEPDYLDPDDDGDGVPTTNERPDGTNLDTDDDGTPDSLDGDDDDDGIVTLRELVDGAPLDTDGDGIANHRDGDDDGDTLPTPFERPDGMDADSDSDGIPDHLDDDDDGDGLPTALENPLDGADSDADGVPDYLDDDDDNDGIPTADERPNGESVDVDQDGIPDYLDASDDFVPDAGVTPPDDEGDGGAPDEMGTPDGPAGGSSDGGRNVLVPTFRDAGPSFAPDELVFVPGELRGGGLSCSLRDQASQQSPRLGYLVALLGLFWLRRRGLRRRKLAGHPLGGTEVARSWQAWLSVMLMLALPGSARAQSEESGYALNRFEPAPRGSDWLTADSLSFRGHLGLSLGGVWEASLKPLVAYDDAGNELGAIVNSQVYTHAAANISLWNLLRLGLNVPVRWFSDGAPQSINGLEYRATQGLAIGDLRLDADARLLGEADAPFRLGVGVLGFVPSGNPDSYTGDGAIRVMPRATAAGDVGAFAYSGQVGGMYRASDEQFDGADPGWEVTYVAGAGYRLLDRQLLLGAELWGLTAFSGEGTLRSRTPLEMALCAHYTEGEWRLGAGFGPGIGTAPGTPTFRFIATLSWIIESLEEGPPPEDGDGDGILDRDDACAHLPGPSHIDPAQNGCPRPTQPGSGN